jgi:hypothetical protein
MLLITTKAGFSPSVSILFSYSSYFPFTDSEKECNMVASPQQEEGCFASGIVYVLQDEESSWVPIQQGFSGASEAPERGAGPRIWEMQKRVPAPSPALHRLLASCLTGGRRESVVDRTDAKSRKRYKRKKELNRYVLGRFHHVCS